MLANLETVLQAINEPPLLGIVMGVAVLLAIVMGEILKQLIGPMFARRHGPSTSEKILERITQLLEAVCKETSELLTYAKENKEWHQEKAPGGLPRAYFPGEEIMKRLDTIEERLKIIQHAGHTP